MGPFSEDFHAIEEAMLADMALAAPSAVLSRALVELRTEPALVMAAPAVDHPFFNRAIVPGSGHDDASLERAIAPSLERFVALGVEKPLLTMTDPAPAAWLARHSLAPFRRWVAYARGTAEPPGASSGRSAVRASPSHARAIGALAARSFGMPSLAGAWLAALVGRSGWHAYVSLEGSDVAGTAMLYIHDHVGYLGFAATDEDHRRTGVQSALLRRRIEDARALGCRVIFAETGEPNGRDRQSSEHNLRRAGFEPIATRHNYSRAQCARPAESVA